MKGYFKGGIITRIDVMSENEKAKEYLKKYFKLNGYNKINNSYLLKEELMTHKSLTMLCQKKLLGHKALNAALSHGNPFLKNLSGSTLSIKKQSSSKQTKCSDNSSMRCRFNIMGRELNVGRYSPGI